MREAVKARVSSYFSDSPLCRRNSEVLGGQPLESRRFLPLSACHLVLSVDHVSFHRHTLEAWDATHYAHDEAGAVVLPSCLLSLL